MVDVFQSRKNGVKSSLNFERNVVEIKNEMRSAWTCRGSETKFTNLIVKTAVL